MKTTVTPKKMWFYITPREWQFASEKGDSFTIAHVLLYGLDKASIVMLPNPHKHNDLNLTLFMSKRRKNMEQISVTIKPNEK